MDENGNTPKLSPPKRKRATKYGADSTTKQKGSPVVGRQSETMFGSGPRANRPGITSETAKLRVKNAEIAARLSNHMLSSVEKLVEDAISRGVPEDIVSLNTTNTLSLMKDAMDREYGKAGGSLDVTSSDGSAKLPTVIQLVGPEPTDNE